MSPLEQLIAQVRQTGDMSALTELIPYARWLGITADASSGELVTTMAYADMLIGNPRLPALHGGTLGGLLETAAIFQLLWAAESVVLPKTINITVEYLRAGAAADTRAVGTITRHGRRVAHVRVDAWQDDRARPIALGHVHFLTLDTASPSAESGPAGRQNSDPSR